LPQEHLASAAQVQPSPARPQQVFGTVEGIVTGSSLIEVWGGDLVSDESGKVCWLLEEEKGMDGEEVGLGRERGM